MIFNVHQICVNHPSIKPNHNIRGREHVNMFDQTQLSFDSWTIFTCDFSLMLKKRGKSVALVNGPEKNKHKEMVVNNICVWGQMCHVCHVFKRRNKCLKVKSRIKSLRLRSLSSSKDSSFDLFTHYPTSMVDIRTLIHLFRDVYIPSC